MAFTRFHDDPQRIKKQLQISTFSERYHLDTPGQGIDMPFLEEPQMRLQQWGANLMTNSINLESDLRGLTRKLNRDHPCLNNYQSNAVTFTYQNRYASAPQFIEESRASHPAWMYKDLEHSRWEKPFLNPQANLEKNFENNVQTRILVKDHFKPTIPVFQTNSSVGDTEYYLSGKSICLGGKNGNCKY
jgi:hypothetical protein